MTNQERPSCLPGPQSLQTGFPLGFLSERGRLNPSGGGSVQSRGIPRSLSDRPGLPKLVLRVIQGLIPLTPPKQVPHASPFLRPACSSQPTSESAAVLPRLSCVFPRLQNPIRGGSPRAERPAGTVEGGRRDPQREGGRAAMLRSGGRGVLRRGASAPLLWAGQQGSGCPLWGETHPAQLFLCTGISSLARPTQTPAMASSLTHCGLLIRSCLAEWKGKTGQT